jgi:hypothetical protein
LGTRVDDLLLLLGTMIPKSRLGHNSVSTLQLERCLGALPSDYLFDGSDPAY